MSKIEDYIKKCINLGFSKSQIVEALKKYNLSDEQINNAFSKIDLRRNLKIGLTASVILLFMFIGLFYPSFIGYVINGGQTVYAENVNMNVSNNSTVVWEKQNPGVLTYLYANGKIVGNGSAKVYLVYNGTRYKIIDSDTLQKDSGVLITGRVVDETLVNDTIIDTTPIIETPIDSVLADTGLFIENPVDEVVVNDSAEVISDLNDTLNVSDISVDSNFSFESNVSVDENVSDVVDNNLSVESNISDEIVAPVVDEVVVNDSIDLVNDSVVVDSNESIVVNETVQELNNTIENNSVVVNQTVETPIEFSFSDICVETCILPRLDSDSFEIEFVMDKGTSVVIDTFTYQTETLAQINESLNLTSNLTINETLNLTSNITINDTIVLNVSSNDSISLFENATINGSVEVDKPVLWVQRIDKNKTNKISLPKETFNITVKKDKVKLIVNSKNVSVEDYNLEKEFDIAKKEKSRIENQIVKDSKNKNVKIKKVNKINSSAIDKKIASFDKRRNKNISLVFNNNISLEFDSSNSSVNISNESQFVDIEYYTEGPVKDEKVSSDFSKEIIISSDIHYQNILAYTDVVESRKEMISLNWITESGKIRINEINYVDTNNNGLIDRIEWTVPHLSNQTYEVNISVLNLHSYPMVGAEWKVEFLTTGKANLTITAENGTVYGRDISPLTLKCGNNVLTPIINGNSVFYADYECNETGYFTALELRQGSHTQKFTFGDATAFAYNYAGNLPHTINLHGKLTNNTGGLINASVNMTFKLYTVSSGGTEDWSETQNNINVSDGVYTVMLGAVNPITVNFTVPYWLGIAVNSDGEMNPRINMTNTPYSFNSYYAQQALEASDLICTDCIGNTEINTTGIFTIDGNLNATNNITLGNSIIGIDGTSRFQITSTGIIVNLQ